MDENADAGCNNIQPTRQKGDETRLLPGIDNEILPLSEAMSIHIQRALKLTNGKIEGAGGAAELLAINPSTLRSRMKKLGVH